jgi:hypothetical protein
MKFPFQTLILVLAAGGFFTACVLYPEMMEMVFTVPGTIVMVLLGIAWAIGAHSQNRTHEEKCRREGRSPWALW